MLEDLWRDTPKRGRLHEKGGTSNSLRGLDIAPPYRACLHKKGGTSTRTYNHHRPHRSLNRQTPAAAHQRLPKTGPHHHGAGTHFRVRKDTIDKSGTVTLRHNGRLHHIGIGRAHKHTPVALLVADLDIRVIDTQTGELLRQLQLDPTRDYQPRNQP